MQLHAPIRVVHPVKPPKKPKRRKSIFLRLVSFAFTAGVILFVAGAAVVSYILWQVSRDLPSYESLVSYEPKVMTRVHASDGSLIAEFAEERRIYVPINAIPQQVLNAFIAAEDQHFYTHGGLDFVAIARALVTNLQNYGSGRSQVGASTITQQVVKNMIVGDERSYMRKIKEAILAVRIERALDKSRILELYVNEIYLGSGSYGVAAAALHYFNKELKDLSIEEMAYLAGLPKAPSRYHPIRNRKEATERRNYVIGRMVEVGFISQQEGDAAMKRPLEVSFRPGGVQVDAADYFAEQARRSLLAQFPDGKLLTSGLSVRTTLDPVMQRQARAALREGLWRYDQRQGWRGPVPTEKPIDIKGDWGAQIAEIPVFSDLDPWKLGVVLEANKEFATVGLQPAKLPSGSIDDKRATVTVPYSEIQWVRKYPRESEKVRPVDKPGASDVLSPGMVVYVAPPSFAAVDDAASAREAEQAKATEATDASKRWRLVQIPEIQGAIVVIDPHTGRILALVGGFSFAQSQYDRSVQARRQPGSSFKPIVYAAALDNGYNPSSIVIDAPLAIEQGGNQDTWRPVNYDGKVGGPSTLRLGIEKSRNLMTVRLALDLGLPIVGEYAKRFGVYDEPEMLPSIALGASATTLLRMTTAYCSFVNGGKQVTATLIDRIQDRYGKTIWRHDPRECEACPADSWQGQDEPVLPEYRPQIISPHTAYQMVSMLEGAVLRGTGTAVRRAGRPLAGKTGTTNEEKDAWFIGFSPDLAVGVYVGFDDPKPMGKGETGGSIAAPIFRDFFKLALAGQPAVPFRVPPDVKLVRVNAKTGMRAQPGEEGTILEAFKPTEDPPDPYSYVGYPGALPDDPYASPPGGGGYGGYEGPTARPRDPYAPPSEAPRPRPPSFGRPPAQGGLY